MAGQGADDLSTSKISMNRHLQTRRVCLQSILVELEAEASSLQIEGTIPTRADLRRDQERLVRWTNLDWG